MMTETNKISKLISAEKILQQQQQKIYHCLHCAKICEGEATSKFQRHLRRPPAEIGGKKNCRIKKKRQQKWSSWHSIRNVSQKTVVSCPKGQRLAACTFPTDLWPHNPSLSTSTLNSPPVPLPVFCNWTHKYVALDLNDRAEQLGATTPEPSSCVWMTCRQKSNTPCPSNLDMAVLCPADTQGWICTVIARKAHHTHMSKQTWYPGEENQGFSCFFSSLSKSQESSEF